jgi:hypothetical protein
LIDPWLSALPVIDDETYVLHTKAGTSSIYTGQNLDIETTAIFDVIKKRRPKLFEKWDHFKADAAEFEKTRQALLERIMAYLNEMAESKPKIRSTLVIMPTFLNWVIATSMLLSNGRENEYHFRCLFTSEVSAYISTEALVYTVRPGGCFAECRSISSSKEEFKEWCDTSLRTLLGKMKDQESDIVDAVRKFLVLSQNLTRIRSEIIALEA